MSDTGKEAILLSSQIMDISYVCSQIIKSLEYMDDNGIELDQYNQWTLHNRRLEANSLHAGFITLNKDILQFIIDHEQEKVS